MTSALLIEPDRSAPRGSRQPDLDLPRSNLWWLDSRPDRPVDEQLGELVDRVRPASAQVRALVDAGTVSASLSVARYLGMDGIGVEEEIAALVTPDGQTLTKLGGQHQLLGWHLEPRIVDFLVTSGAELDVDEYG